MSLMSNQLHLRFVQLFSVTVRNTTNNRLRKKRFVQVLSVTAKKTVSNRLKKRRHFIPRTGIQITKGADIWQPCSVSNVSNHRFEASSSKTGARQGHFHPYVKVPPREFAATCTEHMDICALHTTNCKLPDPAADDYGVPAEGAALHADTSAYLTEDSNYTTLPEESECDGNQLWDSESASTFPRLRVGVKKKRCSHAGEKSYSCNECGKSYPKPCQLKYHMRIHTGERPYICGICGKSFQKTAHLNVHNRTHTGEKPFKCDICGKAFTDSGKQKRHRRSHAGEKPFVCDICGKCYSVHGSLTSHKRSHTGDNAYKCDICNKTFPRPSVLKVHIRSHTGEKPHECGVCGKGFTQFGNLKRHLHSHIMGNRLSSVMTEPEMCNSYLLPV